MRARGTISQTSAAVRSISSSVVKRDSEKRTVLRAWSAVSPMASRTWLGSTRPDEQAAPVETATPLKSSPMTIPSASASRKVMLDVFGMRGAAAPLIVTSAEAATVLSSRSRSARTRSRYPSARASSAATPNAAASGTFSVPARRRRSCAPPNMWRSSAKPARA